MSLWHTKNLGDAMLAEESLQQIKTLFLSAYQQADNPRGMALFVRHESEGRLHCEVKIYFPPASAFVAEAVDAMPCNKPTSDSLDLLAGSETSWSKFFPRNDTQG